MLDAMMAASLVVSRAFLSAESKVGCSVYSMAVLRAAMMAVYLAPMLVALKVLYSAVRMAVL